MSIPGRFTLRKEPPEEEKMTFVLQPGIKPRPSSPKSLHRLNYLYPSFGVLRKISNYLDQSPSREADSRLASQEILRTRV
jgi:hypothetical protein